MRQKDVYPNYEFLAIVFFVILMNFIADWHPLFPLMPVICGHIFQQKSKVCNSMDEKVLIYKFVLDTKQCMEFDNLRHNDYDNQPISFFKLT